MKPLSWNEIRDHAIKFSREWSNATSEEGEKQTFWNEFFEVFGLRRRTVATFEEPVKNIRGKYSYIDLFWRGQLLVEHKSLGKNLGKAESQAFEYIQDLAREGRLDEIPRYVIVSDFARFALYDLEPDDTANLPKFDRWHVDAVEFPLHDLHDQAKRFAFLRGENPVRLDPEDPANVKAAEIMGRLHDALKAEGYSGHPLEQFLVRILFCLFAEDTGIFEPCAFEDYLLRKTSEDGADLGMHLAKLFEVLDTPEEKRQRNLDEDLAAFPYVNGALFKEQLPFADFNRKTRDTLLACNRFKWGKISPAVFGSLFQSVMEPKDRRQQGGHYTSERDILKLVRSLFLDDLWLEFRKIKGNKAELKRFHDRLAHLRFLDPACGCGNFLVITYRELRVLEIEVLTAIHGTKQRQIDVRQLSRLDVSHMHGIELAEFPVRIAEVALWLVDHQMNQRLGEAFGQYFVNLPLRSAPHILQANALRIDWNLAVPRGKCSFVLGNPPFVGKHYQNEDQKADLKHVFGNFKNVGDLDYVVAWFYRAAGYIQGTEIEVGLVGTNSITQGEQVPLVWGLLFGHFKIKIRFAHRTFPWESEARGKAHVHVVIIGFAASDTKKKKKLFDYEPDPTKPSVGEVENISPYLTAGSDAFVVKQQKPLADVPEMRCGNKPSDGGHLILTDTEKAELLAEEPGAKRFLRRFTGSEEFINGDMRWCLWLIGARPEDLRSLPKVMERVRLVKKFRAESSAAPTRKAAIRPTEFFYVSQPERQFIAVPEVSSQRRNYIPIGLLEPEIIVSNKIYLIARPNLYLLGVLSSSMHMAWVRQVCGRLKSDFQYSGTMVYNTFPWPTDSTTKQQTAVEEAAQAVLDVRKRFKPASLADLYDSLAMPKDLAKAHAELDHAVERCYRPQPFGSDHRRVEYLFALYERLTSPLAPSAAGKIRH